ncbi:MAG: class I SAM-dependent methyltransferase [Rhodanobacter sp.]
MNSLHTDRVSKLLATLHDEAEHADREMIEGLKREAATSGMGLDKMVGKILEKERSAYQSMSQGNAERFLAVSAECGRFLYMLARSIKAARIIEFGTSMGVSTVYLAAALRDNGGGHLIGSDLIPSKCARARANVEAAGLSDLVELREGDALQTLADTGGKVDMLLLDGAFSLYLPVLKMLEPTLRPGALIFGENAFDPAYLAYVRDPANGYVSEPVTLGQSRGNELTLRTT